MSILKRSAYFLSGVSPSIMDELPETEQERYIALGMLVLAPVVLALFSAYYAFYTTFEIISLSVVFAFVWATIILTFDRALLTSVRKPVRGGPWIRIGNALKSVLVRGILAILLGIAMAHPVTLRVFQSTIDERLDEELLLEVRATEAKVDEEISRLRMKRRPLFEEITAKEKARNDAERRLQDEIDGRIGSGISGNGTSAMEKRRFAAQIQGELEALKKRVDLEESVVAKQIEAARELLSAQIAEIKSRQSRDLAARTRAFSDLSAENSEILRMGLLLFILLASIEILPVAHKTLMAPGPYDYRVAQIEEEEKMRALAAIAGLELARPFIEEHEAEKIIIRSTSERIDAEVNYFVKFADQGERLQTSYFESLRHILKGRLQRTLDRRVSRIIDEVIDAYNHTRARITEIFIRFRDLQDATERAHAARPHANGRNSAGA